jgi:hypothetical protein
MERYPSSSEIDPGAEYLAHPDVPNPEATAQAVEAIVESEAEALKNTELRARILGTEALGPVIVVPPEVAKEIRSPLDVQVSDLSLEGPSLTEIPFSGTEQPFSFDAPRQLQELTTEPTEQESNQELTTESVREVLKASDLDANIQELIFRLKSMEEQGLDTTAISDLIYDLEASASGLEAFLVENDADMKKVESALVQLSETTERMLQVTLPMLEGDKKQVLPEIGSSLRQLEETTTDLADEIKDRDASEDQRESAPLTNLLYLIRDNTSKKELQISDQILALHAA